MNRVLVASAVAAAFAFAAPVYAQSSEAPAEAPTIVAAAPAANVAGEQRTQRRAFRSPAERAEARLAYIKTALKITDAQSAQWEGFANVVRKHAGEMEQRMQERRTKAPEARAQRAERRNVNAIERLERTQQRMAARSARLTEVISAAKPLYAALSPEQKQVADSMIAHQGKRGGGHHGRGHHRGHRGA